jgi:hypothetical protein
MRWLLLALLLVASAAASGQRQRQPQGPVTILLPVSVEVSADAERKELLAILSRAALLSELNRRGFHVLSDAMTMTSEREMGVKLSDPKHWTLADLQVLAQRWNARFIVGVRLTGLEMEFKTTTAADGSVAPGATLVLTTALTAQVYDAEAKTWAADARKGQGVREQAVPAPVEEEPRGMLLQVLRHAFTDALADWLKAYPPVRR